jgi:hypothetical protein
LIEFNSIFWLSFFGFIINVLMMRDWLLMCFSILQFDSWRVDYTVQRSNWCAFVTIDGVERRKRNWSS